MIAFAEFADDIAKLWSVISTPLIAVAGGAAGTLFGAWLTSRAQHRREIVDQLRATIAPCDEYSGRQPMSRRQAATDCANARCLHSGQEGL